MYVSMRICFTLIIIQNTNWNAIELNSALSMNWFSGQQKSCMFVFESITIMNSLNFFDDHQVEHKEKFEHEERFEHKKFQHQTKITKKESLKSRLKI